MSWTVRRWSRRLRRTGAKVGRFSAEPGYRERMRRWRDAMYTALYGPDGFYTRPGPGPVAHFRTSAHASPVFAGSLTRLVGRVDEALGHPSSFDLVDMGAGRGELLR